MSPSHLRRERELRRQQENREVILSAAEEIIVRKGYSATTMDDIAREAQFSKATVYKYFRRKAELVFEIMVHSFDEVLTRLIEIRDLKKSAKVKLRLTIKMILEIHEDKHNLSQVLMMDGEILKLLRVFVADETQMASASERKAIAILRTKRQETLEVAVDIIEEGIRSGEFRRQDALTTAILIENLVHSYAHGHFWPEKRPDVDRASNLLSRFVLQGIAKPEIAKKGIRS